MGARFDGGAEAALGDSGSMVMHGAAVPAAVTRIGCSGRWPWGSTVARARATAARRVAARRHGA